MVEMLVVLLILAILLALVVGISRWVMAEAAKQQTIATQRIVMLAVEKYGEGNASNDYPADSSNCASLMIALMGEPHAREVLRDLPKDAWGGQNQPLKDGYGMDMRYEKSGGLGGGPVLISCGPDRKKNDGGAKDHVDNKDNIRSDEN